MDKIFPGNPYRTLVSHDGLYESPKDENGKYIGPLVAYAGTEPTTQKNYVGFAYFNMAKVEQDPYARKYFSEFIARKIYGRVDTPTLIVGAPMGGIIFATSTADKLMCNVAFFEKKVIKLPDLVNGTKEESELIFNRHDIKAGDRVVIFDDLCNNFSTTDKMIDLINSRGATVVAIACILNRSHYPNWKKIPVLSVVHAPTPEYGQTDPEVEELVKSGNVVWKPKVEWDRLKKAMEGGNNQ